MRSLTRRFHQVICGLPIACASMVISARLDQLNHRLRGMYDAANLRRRSREADDPARLRDIARSAARRAAGLVQESQRRYVERNKDKCKSYRHLYNATRLTTRRAQQIGAVWWAHVEKEQRALAEIDACWGKRSNVRSGLSREARQKSRYLERRSNPELLEADRRRSREGALARYYRLRHDPAFKMRHAARNTIARICRVVGSRRAKRCRTSEYLGCSYDFARSYLEQRFRDGMTWANHGTVWHIDHVIPLASFDLTKQSQIKKAMHFTNLQPLLAHENRTKQDKPPVQQLDLAI